MSQNRQLSGKQRGKNFSDNENKQLCLSWMRISEDPIHGTDQSLTTFWSAVHEDCLKKNPSFATRTPDGLRQRWGVISRAVQKFSGCYRAVLKLSESGTNEDDKLNKAIQIYKTDRDEEFRYLECWEVLKKCPKFSCVSNPGTSPSTSIAEVPGTPSGPNTPRPIGRNAAKNALKCNLIDIRRAEALERIAAASEQKNNLFQEYTAALKLQNRLNVATARLDGLDQYSAKILLLEKKKLLEEMTCSASNDNATSSIEEESREDIEDSDEFEESRLNAEYLDDQADAESEEKDL